MMNRRQAAATNATADSRNVSHVSNNKSLQKKDHPHPVGMMSSSSSSRKPSLTRRTHADPPTTATQPKLSLPRRIVRTLRSLSASRRSRSQSQTKTTSPVQDDTNTKNDSSIISHIFVNDEIQPKPKGVSYINTTTTFNNNNKSYVMQGAWANPHLYSILGGVGEGGGDEGSGLLLLKLLLQTDIGYHRTLCSQCPDTPPLNKGGGASMWEEAYQGYTKIMHTLMTLIQYKWKSEWTFLQTLVKKEEDEDDLMGSKRDVFIRQLIILRSYSTKNHKQPHQEEEEDVEETPLVSNKKTLMSPSSSFQQGTSLSSPPPHSSSILNSFDIQVLLSALADIFLRLANVAIRDSQESRAIQYLQDARCVQNLPLLNSNRLQMMLNPKEKGDVKQEWVKMDSSVCTTPGRKLQNPDGIEEENLSPDSVSSSPAIIQSPSMEEDEEEEEKEMSTLMSPLSSSSMDETCLFIMDSHDSAGSKKMNHHQPHDGYTFASSLPTTMKPDQQRIHSLTMHNFINLASLSMMNLKKKRHVSSSSQQDMIQHYDNMLQMYSDCLRWKRRTLRELEKDKKKNSSSFAAAFAYEDAEMSLTRTLVNIGTLKAQSILLKPQILPPGGSPSHEHSKLKIPSFFSSSMTSWNVTSTIPLSQSPREQERWLKAERFLKQALALRVQYHGLEDRDVASNLMSLGDFYFIQGRLDMALRSYQEVVRIQMVLKEDNLLFTAMTWYNLAVAQYRMGHYEHARESAARALMIRMKHVENVDSIGHNMASILYVFGMAQSSLGEYDDARKNFNRALVIRKKLFSQDHLLILNVIKAMGIVSLNEENWDDAMSMFLQVYRKRSWRLGFEHPVSLEALYFLALAIRDKGEDSTVAFEMLNVVIECLCKHVGDEDTKVVDAMCALAESYRKCRMWDHALMIIKQALKVCEQNVGKQHVMYANVMRGLGEIQLEQGDIDGALRSFQHVIQIFMLPDNAVTVTVLQTSDVWQRIAKAYFQKAEYHFSSQAYVESLKLKVESISHSDPSYWRLLSLLGQAQYKCGDLRGAFDSFTESSHCQSLYYLPDIPSDTALSKPIILMALETIRDTLQQVEKKAMNQIEDDLEHFAVTLNVLGIINQELGNLSDAIESFDLCFLARNIKPSRDYEALGHTADTLGLLYFGAGQHQKALSAFRDALSIKESGLGENSLEVARTLNNMGNVYFANGKLDEAIDHYNQSFEIKKRMLGANHEEVVNTLNNIAHVLFKSDRLEESFKTYVDVFQMRRLLYGDNSLALAVTYCNIGDVRLQLGKFVEAKDCFERCLQIRKLHNTSNYEDNVRIMESLARVEGKLRSWNNATDLYHEVVEIRKSRLGQEKTEALSKTLQLLAHSLIEQKRYHEALPNLYEALRIRTLYVLSSSSEEISELMQVINFCKTRQQPL